MGNIHDSTLFKVKVEFPFVEYGHTDIPVHARAMLGNVVGNYHYAIIAFVFRQGIFYASPIHADCFTAWRMSE